MLFSQGWLSEILDGLMDRMRREIEKGDRDEVIRQGTEHAVEQIYGEHVLELVRIDWSIRDKAQNIQNRELKVSFHVTFTGDRRLLQYRPSSYSGDGRLEGKLQGCEIRREIAGPLGMGYFKRELEQWRAAVKQQLRNVNEDARKHNKHLRTNITRLVDERAKQLDGGDNVADGLDFD